ncbi:MAG: hypothetical protein QXW00_03920 [Candidatus Woesearchaeota archaeon]
MNGIFLKPTKHSIMMFIMLFTFFSIFFLAAGFPYYIIILLALFLYLYVLHLSRRLESGKIKNAWRLALELTLGMLCFLLALLIFYAVKLTLTLKA